MESASIAERRQTPGLAERAAGFRARVADLWGRRPGVLHDRTVLGLLITLIALLLLFLGALVYLKPDRPGDRLALDEVSRLADAGRIDTLTLHDHDAVVTGRLDDGRRFSASYPADGAVTATLIELGADNGARVAVDQQATKESVRTITTFLLPLMILANLFALLFVGSKAAGGGIGAIETFGTLRGGKGEARASTGVTFDDVAGAGEAVTELREVVDYLRDPTRYADVGAAPPKGVLLFGPPGCGKTLIARAVAGEAGVPFFNVSGAEFVESLVGVGAARVRDLFLKVREVAPAILFVDELDAAARRRGVGGGTGGADEREQTLNQLLVEVDGFDVSQGIVVIGATNRPDILDPAVLRPGRFDRHVTVDHPSPDDRQKILELHARGKPIDPAVDFSGLARRTPGFTGADLANVINEAALLTVRERRGTINEDLLDEAVQRVLHGPQRRGRVLSPAERERAAIHESGHAIVAAAHGKAEDVHRVSILARGRGLGLTGVRQDSDAVLHTRDDLLGQLEVTLAGLAAEELILGQPSTGAEQDVEHATVLAREIAGRYGMSEALGRARLVAHDADEFLGTGMAVAMVSESTHEALDAEVRRLLDEAETGAKALIKKHRKVLDRLVETLLDREAVEGDALTDILTAVA